MKKLTEKKIAESAGKIIYQSGLDNLSVDGLAGELRTDRQSVEVFCKSRKRPEAKQDETSHESYPSQTGT